MRQLYTNISGAPMPNYIAIAEPSTRPDIVHCLYTPSNPLMKSRLDALIAVCKSKYPSVKFNPIEVENASDSKSTWNAITKIPLPSAGDEILLNRVTGTEQMRAPLVAAFEERAKFKPLSTFKQFFVETERQRIAFVEANWETTGVSFESVVSVKDYFSLHGHIIAPASNSATPTTTEASMVSALKRLQFHDLLPGAKWIDSNKNTLAEFDAMGVHHYSLYVFERKKLQNLQKGKTARTTQDQSRDVVHDIEKLAYCKSYFGGVFGRAYWHLSGGYKLPDSHMSRLKSLGLQIVNRDEEYYQDYTKLGLPPPL